MSRWQRAGGGARACTLPRASTSARTWTLTRLGAAALLLAALLVLCGLAPATAAPASAAPASAAPAWGPPFRVAGPMSLDLLPAHVEFSSRGQASIAFALNDEDAPSASQAYVISRSSGGALGALRTIPGAQEVLDQAFVGGTLELLTGSSPKGYACCSSVKLVSSRGGSFAATKTLVRGLTGASVGRLLSMPGNLMLAAVASQAGVWGGSSAAGGRPPVLHRLSPSGTGPQALGAAALQGGRSVVAWSPTSPAGSIYVAVGPKLPKGVKAFSLPAGHHVDQLAVAPTTGNAAVAWIESWIDRRGSFHSQAATADLAGAIKRFAVAGALASELSFAGNSHGEELLVWKACGHSGGCTVQGVAKSGSGHFGHTLSFGRVDASQAPSAAVASDGAMLVGWIDHGHVLAADRAPGAAAFSAAHVVSSTTFAADLTIAFGPKHVALAVWTQGTYAQSVMAAAHR